MKKLSVFLLIGIVVIIACKKDNEKNNTGNSDPEPEYCYNVAYWDTIPKFSDPFYLYKYIEDKSFNLIIVWSDGSDTKSSKKVTKLDSNLNHVWSNTYDFEGMVANIISDEYNNLYVTTYQHRYESEGGTSYFEDIYLQEGRHPDTCSTNYSLVSGDFGYTYTDLSKTWVHKISPEGDLINTIEFLKACRNGNNLMVLDNGDLVVATYTLLGDNFEFVYRDGVFQDTINRPDSTFLNIYRVSSTGAPIWEKNIKIPTFHDYEFYAYTLKTLAIDLTSNGNNLFVTAFNAIYTLNQDGDILNKFEFPTDKCAHKALRSTSVVDGGFFIICQHDQFGTLYNQPLRYVAYYTPPDNLEWVEELPGYAFSEISVSEDRGYYLFYNDHYIAKHSNNGFLEWRKEWEYHNGELYINCNNGYLLMQTQLTTFPEHIVITRTDQNGEY